MDSAIDVVEHEAKRAERPEPEGAFVYQPPSPELRQRFSHIFALTEPLPERPLKLAFDRGTALFLSLATLPLLCLLYLAYLIEGLIMPAHRGPFLISYDAVSRGRVFPKYKVRVVKRADIDGRAAARGEWHGYAAEWSPASRTYVGALVKRLYLDELPQLYNVLAGQISMVGPRPLAVHHYQRDLAQGNVSRRLVKAGILGATQALKGTSAFGRAEVECEYVDRYMRLSPFRLLSYDLHLAWRCFLVMLKARGL